MALGNFMPVNSLVVFNAKIKTDMKNFSGQAECENSME